LSVSIIIQSAPLVNAVRPGTSRTAAKAGITGRSTRAFKPPNEADDAARGERPSGRADRLPRPAAAFSSRIRCAAAQAGRNALPHIGDVQQSIEEQKNKKANEKKRPYWKAGKAQKTRRNPPEAQCRIGEGQNKYCANDRRRDCKIGRDVL